MAGEPDNMILVYLRRFDEKFDRVIDDMRDLKTRMTAVAEGLVGIHRRLDRLETRVERIERRLDLVDQPH